MVKLCWGITGSGYFIEEIIDIMTELNSQENMKITVITSRAAKQMLKWYKLWDRLQSTFNKVLEETNSNAPFIAGPLQIGKYDILLIAPLTANSTAKIAYGIADTLITNAVAQTLKGKTPVLLYPVDQKDGEITTITPDGSKFTIRARGVDLENVERIKQMSKVVVLRSPKEILSEIDRIIKASEA